MRKLIIFFVSLLLGAVFLFGLFRYVVNWEELQEELTRVRFLEMGAIVFFAFISLLIGTLRWKEVLKAFGSSFSLKELFPARIASFGIVYLIPIGVFWADILRAKAIGVKKKADFSINFASVLVDRIFNMIINLVLVSVGFLLFFRMAGTLWLELRYVYLTSLFFFSLVLFFIIFFILSPEFSEKIGFLDFFFNSFSHKKSLVRKTKKEIISFFKTLKPSAHFKILLFSVLHGASLVFLSFLIISFLGYKISFVSTWALFGPTYASLETPVSADLGSHDLVSAFVCEALGMRRSTGVVYAFLFRGANLVLTAVGLLFLLKIGVDAFKDHLLKRF